MHSKVKTSQNCLENLTNPPALGNGGEEKLPLTVDTFSRTRLRVSDPLGGVEVVERITTSNKQTAAPNQGIPADKYRNRDKERKKHKQGKEKTQTTCNGGM